MPGIIKSSSTEDIISRFSSSSPGSPPSSRNSSPISIAPFTRLQAASLQQQRINGSSKSGLGSLAQNGFGMTNRQERSFLGSQEGGINVGDEYQARIPDYDPRSCLSDYAEEEAREERQSICIWNGPFSETKISDEEITKFCKFAREQHGFGAEQALGLLHYANMDLEKAVESLDEYRPVDDEWSKQDQERFEQGVLFYGKNFRRLSQLLPEKSIPDLVRFYYTMKKKRREQMSVAEQQYKKRKAAWIDSLERFESEQRSDHEDYAKVPRFDSCIHCQLPRAQLHPTPKGLLCGMCFLYWKRIGKIRPIGDQGAVNGGRNSQTDDDTDQPDESARNSELGPAAPDEMSLNVDDFLYFMPSPNPVAEAYGLTFAKRLHHLRKLAAELEELRADSQKIKAIADNCGFASTVSQELQDVYDISHLKKDRPLSKKRVPRKRMA